MADAHQDQLRHADAVDHSYVDEDDDLMALEAICKFVPPELQEIMAIKPSARAAWEDLKTINLGVERVRWAKADMLRRKFDSLAFKDGETIDDFSLRINGVV